MSAPTFSIVYTPACTYGVFSDGRVCRVAFDPDTDAATFTPIGVCDRAQLWPDAADFEIVGRWADNWTWLCICPQDFVNPPTRSYCRRCGAVQPAPIADLPALPRTP